VRMHALVQQLHSRYQPAVLLVTHDVDEAVLLADRVLVLTDGVISLDEPVGVPSPRLRGDPAFIALRSRLLRELGVDEAAEGARPSAHPNHQSPNINPGDKS
jgi:sulfonate transport system ATP-binding protein